MGSLFVGEVRSPFLFLVLLAMVGCPGPRLEIVNDGERSPDIDDARASDREHIEIVLVKADW